MGNVKGINIKNRTYHFLKDTINIKDFDSNLLKIAKKSYKNIDIYHIEYLTINKNLGYENIHSVKPLHLTIGEVDGFIEKKQ